MNIDDVRPGMLVIYHQDAVEVVSVETDHSRAEVRRLSDALHFTARCDDLLEDPQTHTDCGRYY